MNETRIEVVIAAKDQATAVLRGLAGSVSSLAGQVSTIGAAISGLGLGALAAFTANSIKAAADLDDLAEITGASVEELSKLEQVAIVSGVAIDGVAAASVKLSKGLGEAEDPASNAARALAAIGLSAKELKGLDTAQQMQRLAQALGGFGDGAGKTQVALALLGKDGARLLPYLKDLAEAGELNATLTKEQAAAAEAYEKANKKVALELNKVGKQIAVESIPVLTALKKTAFDVASEILGISTAAGDAARANAIRQFAETAGNALAFVGDAAQGVVTAFQAAGTVIGGIAALPVGNWEGFKRGLADIGNEVDSLFMRETFSSRFKRQFAEIVAAAKKTAAEIKTGVNFSLGEDKGRQKEFIDESREALARFVQELEKESQKLEQITLREQALRILRGDPGLDTAQVRELLNAEIAIVEARRTAAAARKEDTEAEAKLVSQMKSLDDQLAEFSGRAEQARKIALTARLEARLAAGETFGKEELERMVKGIGGIREEIEKTKGVGEELGLVFASSLGRFLDDPSGGARNFFKSLLQDIQKLIIQLLIVKPLAESIQRLFKGIGTDGGGSPWGTAASFTGGGGGGGFNFWGLLAQGVGAIAGTGTATGGGASPWGSTGDWFGTAAAASTGPINVFIDGAIDRARITSYVETGVRAGIAASVDSTLRGGSGTIG